MMEPGDCLSLPHKLESLVHFLKYVFLPCTRAIEDLHLQRHVKSHCQSRRLLNSTVHPVKCWDSPFTSSPPSIPRLNVVVRSCLTLLTALESQTRSVIFDKLSDQRSFCSYSLSSPMIRSSRFQINDTRAAPGPAISPTPSTSPTSHIQCFKVIGLVRELQCNWIA